MHDQRVIYNTFDISQRVGDFRTSIQPLAYVQGGQLFIGSVAPFNNLWLEIPTPNTNAANPTVQVWFQGAWVDVVDLYDGTAGMSQSGRISWAIDQASGWDKSSTTEAIPGHLSAFKIYWKFWLRVTWDADFSAGTAVNYIGQKFSDDVVLGSFYPDLLLPNLMQGFQAGKSDWTEQHYMATEHIIRDLKKNGIIRSRSQLLNWEILQDAACHKVADIVYTAFGSPYFDQKETAHDAYVEAVKLDNYYVDHNENATVDPSETTFSTSFARR